MSNQKEPADTPPRGGARLIASSLLAGAGIALVLGVVLGLDFKSGETNDWYLFLGRFHPLFVHLPIGFLVLAWIFELIGAVPGLRHLRRAVPAILTLTALSAAAAVVHGCLLVAGEGEITESVERHMWAGAWFAIAAFLLLPLAEAARLFSGKSIWKIGYHFGLFGGVILLSGASHLGGNLTHGPDYLVRYMPEGMKSALADFPAPVREFIGLRDPAPPAAEVTLYDAVFAPAFDQYCVSCHNADRTRGGLRMDTLAELMKGGTSGPAITLGRIAESELYTRITLPHDDEDFMPPDGKKPLPDETVAMIHWWIESGLDGATPADQVADAPENVLAVLAEAIARGGRAETGSEEEVVVVAEPTYDPATLDQINAKIPGRLLPVSRNPADGLILVTAGTGDAFTDTTLAEIAPLAAFLREADLSRTAITDAGMEQVATWSALRRLRLDHTQVGNSGVARLKPLDTLESLNLYGSAADGGSADDLLALPALKSLFFDPSALDEPTRAKLGSLLPVVPPPPPEPEPVAAENEEAKAEDPVPVGER